MGRKRVQRSWEGATRVSLRYYSLLHLERLDDASQDTAADADVTSEGALLVDVVQLTSLPESTMSAIVDDFALQLSTHFARGLEAKANILHESKLERLDARAKNTLLVLEDGLLLLVSTLGLCDIHDGSSKSWRIWR